MDVIPDALLHAEPGLTSIGISKEAREAIDLRIGGSDADALAERFVSLFPDLHHWGPEIIHWGDEKADDITAYLTDGVIEVVRVRLDVRNLSLRLLSEVCSLAREQQWSFVGPGGTIIPPQPASIMRRIELSDSFPFVSDPIAYLKQVAAQDGPPED